MSKSNWCFIPTSTEYIMIENVLSYLVFWRLKRSKQLFYVLWNIKCNRPTQSASSKPNWFQTRLMFLLTSFTSIKTIPFSEVHSHLWVITCLLSINYFLPVLREYRIWWRTCSRWEQCFLWAEERRAASGPPASSPVLGL